MSQIIAWFKSKNISSHVVAVTIVALATLIVTDSQVQAFVLQLFATYPKIGTAIVAIAGIIFKYSHSTPQPPSPQGALK
jgi:hypothetical protein